MTAQQSPPKKTYRIGALGCRTNQYEAQAFRDQLEALGYVQALDGEKATVSIVNTCTVTESADSHSRHMVRDFLRKSPDESVFVTGCFAERNPDAIVQISDSCKVVPNCDKEDLVKIILPDEEPPEFRITQFEAHTRAFVKVQDGCNSFCTYCIIPYVRGRSRSRTIPEVVDEVKGLVSNGYKEVVLTGINIGDFDGAKGKDEPPHTLSDLVRAVDEVDGLERLRISSIDPDEIDEDLASAVLYGKRTCNSMHIVLQSGSNVVLKRMNRKYTRQDFFETVRRLQAMDPDFTVTTDVIVGFPGESESDFEETLDVMKEIRFAKMHMFPYSARPRTRAALYPNKVDSKTMQNRKAEVLALSEKIAYELRDAYVGRTMTVLTESKNEGGFIFGHTANFLPVFIQNDTNIQENSLVSVYLESNTAQGLNARVIS